jgi:hypothetical protein
MKMKPKRHELNEPAYRLTHDVGRFERYEPGYYADLWIEGPAAPAKEASASNPILYRGYPPIVETVDFPVTNNLGTVMSRQMLDALKSAGEFPHTETPVVIVDTRLQRDDWYDARGNLRAGIAIQGYVAVRLNEHLDIFDYDRSKYTHNPNFPDYIGDVDEYVFKPSKEGLPPLFQIKGEAAKLFVSQTARSALKDAKITGIKYISLKGIKRGEGMFVDVATPIPAEE